MVRSSALMRFRQRANPSRLKGELQTLDYEAALSRLIASQSARI
jgi:hypothetical protein